MRITVARRETVILSRLMLYVTSDENMIPATLSIIDTEGGSLSYLSSSSRPLAVSSLQMTGDLAFVMCEYCHQCVDCLKFPFLVVISTVSCCFYLFTFSLTVHWCSSGGIVDSKLKKQ